MIVLVATAGRPGLLKSTLQSIVSAERPSSFEAIVVVENGPPCGAEAVCQQMTEEGAPVRFLRCSQVGKSAALNYALPMIRDESLVVMTDDDVQWDKRLLTAYDREAQRFPSGRFFGGPCGVEYEEEPPAWIKRYLPSSVRGWAPTSDQFNPNRDCFLGSNWAAFARDLKAAGGFDPRFGPGAPSGGTGQESEMQKRLYAAGFVAQLVPDAVTYHFVPRERCSPQWAIARARRNGISRGIAVSSRSPARQFSAHCSYGLKLAVSSAQSVLTLVRPGSKRHFHATYRRSRSLGYFQGVRFQRAA